MQCVIVLPAPAAETYTAHATAIPAVQFNTVYPTPCTTVPSIRIGAASDKRYSLALVVSAAFSAASSLTGADPSRISEYQLLEPQQGLGDWLKVTLRLVKQSDRNAARPPHQPAGSRNHEFPDMTGRHRHWRRR